MAGQQGRRGVAQPCKRFKEAAEPQVGQAQQTGTGQKKRSALGDVTNSAVAAAQLPQKAFSSRPSSAHQTQADAIPSNSRCAATAFVSGAEGRVRGLQHIKDIDCEAAADPLACAAYAPEIFDNLFEAEKSQRPSTTYMERIQPELDHTMRSVLIDWLVEVAQEFKLVPETLFLAVSFLDRFLSVEVTARNSLQLVGITCVLVAAKYEEIYAPSIAELCYITDNTYSKQEVLAMERRLLDALGFQCTVPTSRVFVRRFVQAAAPDFRDSRHSTLKLLSWRQQAGVLGSRRAIGNFTPLARANHLLLGKLGPLASYLTELGLTSYPLLAHLPSDLAAAAVLVAQWALGSAAWTPTLGFYTRKAPADIELAAHHVLATWQQASRSATAVRDKYSGPKYQCVGNLVPPVELPEWLFQPLAPSLHLRAPSHPQAFSGSELHLPLGSASAMQLHGPQGFAGGFSEHAENLIPAIHALH